MIFVAALSSDDVRFEMCAACTLRLGCALIGPSACCVRKTIYKSAGRRGEHGKAGERFSASGSEGKTTVQSTDLSGTGVYRQLSDTGGGFI